MLFLYLSTVNIHGGTLFLGGLDSLVDKVVLKSPAQWVPCPFWG